MNDDYLGVGPTKPPQLNLTPVPVYGDTDAQPRLEGGGRCLLPVLN